MDFLQFAASRYSVRKFEDKPLEQEVIDKLVAASHIAPTGCNNQPQRILVINTPDAIAKLRQCTRSHFDAPTAMLICYNKEESWIRKRYDNALSAPTDAAIVTTHIMLMAHSLGIGSTWVMHFDPVAMRKEFLIPENVEPLALLVMGYPHPEAEPSPMHSDFRSLEEVIVYDHF